MTKLPLLPQDAGVRYICAGVAEQQEGLYVLNLTSNNISQEGVHHVSAMLVSPLCICVHSCDVMFLAWQGMSVWAMM